MIKPTEAHWISVKDQLPKNAQTVLVICNNPQNHNDAHIGICEFNSWRDRDGTVRHRWSRNYHVTYWAPLPEMPDIFTEPCSGCGKSYADCHDVCPRYLKHVAAKECKEE